MDNYSRKVKKLKISDSLIIDWMINGVSSFKPINDIPKDLKLVNVKKDDPMITIAFFESESFDEVKEGFEVPDWELTFERV